VGGIFDTNGFDSTLSQGITGTGAFVKDGAGTLTLLGVSSVAGGTGVIGGTLRAGAADIFTGAGGVAVGSAGTLDLAGFDQTVTNVLNQGLIRTGGIGSTNLTVTGAYIGLGGTLALNTFLGADGSPSDRLVLNGGAASGSTTIRIANIGGAGAQTIGDGILVVNTINGGTMASGAFALGNIVAAGAYEYMLFRGGVTAGTTDNWYLRSELVSPLSPPNPPGPQLPNPMLPEPALPPPPPAAPIPLFRPEASLYAQVPSVARQLQLFTLGTFHQRQGDQSLGIENNLVMQYAPGPELGSQSGPEQRLGSSAWVRAYGQTFAQRWDGALSPEFSGQMVAVQAGADVVQYENARGQTGRAGLFYAYSEASGDARGFALGQQGLPVGTLPITSQNVGAYWSHIGPSQWYLDAVAMGSFFAADPMSYRQIGAYARGDGVTASLEAGVPFYLSGAFRLEPQGQIIWQHMHFDDTSDPFSLLHYDLKDSFVGRLGLRLETATWINGVRVQPFALANLWRTFEGSDQTLFNNSLAFPGSLAATSLEVGGGAIAQVTDRFSAYLRGSYTTNLGGNFREAAGGQLGLRATW
jgi:outer membrane autotransporter protein